MVRDALCVAGVVAALGQAAVASTYDVPGDFATIQDAIADPGTVAGDVIVVHPGVYVENIDFLGKAITVRSTDPSDPGLVAATIIDGGGFASTASAVSGETPATVLSGLTLTNGGGPEGGGLLVSGSSPTISNCRFWLNGATFGGGISVASGAPHIVNCVFLENAAGDSGAGIHVGAAGAPTVANCTFVGNVATRGAAAAGCGAGSFTNCTMAVNTALLTGGGFYACGGGTVTATNSILWGNLFDQISHDGTAAFDVTYSNVQGGFPGTGNIDADPTFADAAGLDGIPGNGDDDLHLANGSPCIDAGDNAALPGDTADLDTDGNTIETTPVDLDGDARLVDDPATADTGSGTAPIVDMGAYEHTPGPAGCPWDLDGSGGVGITDLLDLLADWGETGVPADMDGGGVGITDLLGLLAAWGPCPGEAAGANGPPAHARQRALRGLMHKTERN